MADRTGQQLGNYHLTRLLGQGGFADVYHGEHVYLKTQAAIKILQTRLAHNDMEDFLKEARTIANLTHPHIVRIIDFGLEDNTPFLVMEYAPHDTLRQRHAKGVSLPLDAIVIYVKQIASALQYAHNHKLIHRDVKPENMLIGQHQEILLSDFGIALSTQSSRYQSTHEVVGTAAYMAPEQLQGKPQPASDQYALAIVVYEWLTGERPFHGSFAELCAQHIFTLPPPLHEKVPTILPDVEHVVTTALSKDPNQRFGSIQAFATALEQAREGSVATLLFTPTGLRPSASSTDSTLTAQQRPYPSRGASSLNNTEPSRTVSVPSSTAPATQRGSSSTAETFIIRPPSSGEPPVPVTVILEQVHSSSSPRRKRKVLMSVLISLLAIVLIVVPVITIASVYALEGRGGSSGGNGFTVTVQPGSTSSPNGVVFVPTGTPTGTATSSLTGTAVSSPTVPAKSTPTSTVGSSPTALGGSSLTPTTPTPSLPTNTPTPPSPTDTPTTPTPPPSCPTPPGTNYFDDFSSYAPGQPPNGYIIRGASGVTPTIQNVGGTNLLNFPAVSGEYWDSWVLKDGLTLCNSYTVTAKLNFQTSGDRGGVTIAWNDANWDRIDIQPNIYFQNIEFHLTYTGSIPSSPSVTGPALNRYSLPMNVGSDYWLRIVATSAGPGQCQVIVYWSTDGTNFTPEVTATGLATVTGQAGVGTSGPNLPNVYFENFQAQEN